MNSECLIVTISDYENMGNRLQNYAVYKSLEKYGAIVGTKGKSKFYLKFIIKQLCMSLPNIPYMSKIIWGKSYRKYLFWNFSSKIPTIYKCFDGNEVEISKNVRWVFYGSDQIWNPEFGPRNCIIPVTPISKNVAICASIGADSIPDEKIQDYKLGLARFTYISVREDKAADIVEKITGNRPVVLIDPTLSIERSVWSKLERKPCGINNKKYIFLYFLGQLSEKRKTEIKLLSEKLGVDVINANDSNIKKIIGPSEFLWLIHNSVMVITDSYHGSIFSFIFDKSFYILNREDEEIKMSMNSRFDTLFNKLKLSDRRCDDISGYAVEHDYSRSYELLNDEVKKYYSFINTVIGDK